MNTAEAYNNIHLAIMAIERGAQLMKVSPKEMYMRLKAQGLIHNFLLPYYEELHSQSVDWLAATTAETLKKLGSIKMRLFSPERALDIYYTSKTAKLLSDPNSGMQLMSDNYVFEDLMAELNQSSYE